VNALLVRVGADQSPGGGLWNGPVDSRSGRFAYVPIPEAQVVHPGLERSYALLKPALDSFSRDLPAHLQRRGMHLDPDFEHLTYGDKRERAKQIQVSLGQGDTIVFYAGLADVGGASRLVYALVGLLVVEEILPAVDVPREQWDTNAHCRRLAPGTSDIVVRGRADSSGRLARCLPIGEYRDRAYRVRRDLLGEWGGLSVKDGYLQRSARLPRFLDAPRFIAWLESQRPVLMRANN
jgi:hypothetical protein